ncbi:hypothetical protein HK414_15790 [Ramlibacter terrae]|uniref:Uncharacterized protein n=1 Tax=Ramlibacter terrae TaxID=2732511 RepID=A0ABX6P5F4_9BURK|nr:hypothetical protein HK414_15790 [Ramlibacter terrae]
MDVAGAGLSLSLLAGRDFVQAQDVSASVDGGVLRVSAVRDATVESMIAGTGVVWLQAVDVVDGDAAGDTESDVQAYALVLAASGGTGSGDNALETTIDVLAGSGAAAGIFVTETDALSFDEVDFSVLGVLENGTAALSGPFSDAGLRGDDIVVRTVAGNLSSEAVGTVSATGNLRLATASGYDITLAGAITNDGGSTTIDSGGELALDASITASATGETIELVAAPGIVQAQGTAVTSADGAIVLRATEDITTEALDAGTASVRIEGASVLDGDAAGDAEVDIAAGGLLIAATGSVAATGAALETSVSRITAMAEGDIFVTETDGVEVGQVDVTVRSVGEDGTATAVVLDNQSVLQGATIVLRARTGRSTSWRAAPCRRRATCCWRPAAPTATCRCSPT